MEWRSFADLKHGRRQVPRIDELERLARLLEIDAAFVFEVARGVSARKVYGLLRANDPTKLAYLLMTGIQEARWKVEGTADTFRAVLDRVNETGDLEKRRFVRVPLKAAVAYESEGRAFEGVCRNLSRGGLFIETDRPLPRRTRIAVRWRLGTEGSAVTADGVVAWNTLGDAQAPAGMGVEFTKIAPADRRVIIAHVNQARSRCA